MKKLVFILTLPLLFVTLSCSVSTKNINNREPGFFFERKSKYFKVNDENYQISIPEKANDEGKIIVKIKPENGKKIEKELSGDEYSKIREILKSNTLSDENKKAIRRIIESR